VNASALSATRLVAELAPLHLLTHARQSPDAQLRFLREVKRLRDEDSSRFNKACFAHTLPSGCALTPRARPQCSAADTLCNIFSDGVASVRCSRCDALLLHLWACDAIHSTIRNGFLVRHTTSTKTGTLHARSTSWYRSGRRNTSGATCGTRCAHVRPMQQHRARS
jgi:hypothetical protein